jgi:hypothetical protein
VQARRCRPAQQGRDAVGALAGRVTGAHRHGDPVGAHARGDEHLLAVDHVVVATFKPRRGAQAGHVGAATGFGDRQRGDLLAAQHRRDHSFVPLIDVGRNFFLRKALRHVIQRGGVLRQLGGVHGASLNTRWAFS